jgi:hypothetical protein
MKLSWQQSNNKSFSDDQLRQFGTEVQRLKDLRFHHQATITHSFPDD